MRFYKENMVKMYSAIINYNNSVKLQSAYLRSRNHCESISAALVQKKKEVHWSMEGCECQNEFI